MKRKIVPIAVLALLLGVFFDFLIFEKTPGISVVLYVAAVIAATLFLARQHRARLSNSIYFLIPLTLLFASMVFVRASEFLTFLNILLIIYLLLLEVKLATTNNGGLQKYWLSQYLSGLPWLIPRSAGTALQEVQRTSSDDLRSHHKSSYVPYVRGIVLSLPILVVLLLLLSSADLVFQKYVGTLLDFQVDGELIFRIVVIGIIAAIFLGAYILMFGRPKTDENEPRTIAPTIGTTETTIILGSVSLLFLIFVLVQAAYLFGGSDQIAAAGFTYAEYARKGFFELIAVAVITMALIWAVKQSGRFDTPRRQNLFKLLCGILIAEVLVIMVSAHLRLSLYESAYGFTELRLLSHMFIALLAVTFVSLFIHIYFSEPERRFAFRTFLSVIAFFAILNFLNPEALIARQNIERFEKTGKLDTAYLQQLSEDAAPEISRLLSHPDPKIRENIAKMFHAKEEDTLKKLNDWQSYNLARDEAADIYRGL